MSWVRVSLEVILAGQGVLTDYESLPDLPRMIRVM